MKYLLVIVISLLTGFILATNQSVIDTRADTVYAICNQSRVTPNVSERECARLQERWNVEFMCQANNDLPENICWTEVK